MATSKKKHRAGKKQSNSRGEILVKRFQNDDFSIVSRSARFQTRSVKTVTSAEQSGIS